MDVIQRARIREQIMDDAKEEALAWGDPYIIVDNGWFGYRFIPDYRKITPFMMAMARINPDAIFRVNNPIVFRKRHKWHIHFGNSIEGWDEQEHVFDYGWVKVDNMARTDRHAYNFLTSYTRGRIRGKWIDSPPIILRCYRFDKRLKDGLFIVYEPPTGLTYLIQLDVQKYVNIYFVRYENTVVNCLYNTVLTVNDLGNISIPCLGKLAIHTPGYWEKIKYLPEVVVHHSINTQNFDNFMKCHRRLNAWLIAEPDSTIF
jgi:hypothetical protein